MVKFRRVLSGKDRDKPVFAGFLRIEEGEALVERLYRVLKATVVYGDNILRGKAPDYRKSIDIVPGELIGGLWPFKH